MSVKLPKFTFWPMCKKCGFDEYQAFHVNDNPDVEYKRGQWLEDIQMNVEDMGYMHEYLLRTCRRCGFKWAEATINTEE